MSDEQAAPSSGAPESTAAIEVVGVVGAGIMGSGIAEVCARAGVRVELVDVDDGAVAAGLGRVEKSLARAVSAGKLTQADADAARARITAGTDLRRLAPAGLVVEAVVEREAAKRDIFARLDAIVADPAAILASNTSSIPITRIAAATGRPQQVIGLHFFNPVPVLPLVEIVPSQVTLPAVEQRVRAFATGVLGKTAIRAKDRAGFVVNALLIPYLLAAVRMLDSGIASAEDIDSGMVHGCAHPMGPLRLADLIGLDTVHAIAEAMYGEFREPQYAPAPLLSRMVEAGLLGRKSGQGFYDYRASA